ncbi:hypothetical protein [Nocardia abscessus]|uniref:hypothetical protein n=1 Tax=Nocardia abscessus TaxID=120957 RepID=UPI002453D41C|nr:hypothetical protein [Nocardia abscessus]
MSAPESSDGQEKKLAVGLNLYRHTQLTWIAQLRGTTMTTEFLKAIDAHIETAKSDPELIAKADEVRAAIERDAQAKQAALANLFQGAAPGGGEAAAQPTPPRSKGCRTAGRLIRPPGEGRKGGSSSGPPLSAHPTGPISQEHAWASCIIRPPSMLWNCVFNIAFLTRNSIQFPIGDY